MYNKLFTKILDSSIWLEPTPTRLVWLVFLAVMDEDGFCQFASPANLAHRARLTVDEVNGALETLEAPDANSSDPDHDGRRVERVPGGWIVLNAGKYRELVTREVIREKTRLRVKKHREEKRGNAPVTASNASVTPSETVSGAETDTKSETSSIPLPDASATPSLVDKAERERVKRLPTTEPAIRISGIFHRRVTTAWSDGEIKAFKTLSIYDPDDLSALEDYYANSGSKYLRKDLSTFLNNYMGEVDRAKAWASDGRKSSNGSVIHTAAHSKYGI